MFHIMFKWLLSAKIHYTSFPVASPRQVGTGRSPSVVSVVSLFFPNSITTTDTANYLDMLRLFAVSPTSPQQVRNKLATPRRLRESYGETCLMDFGHSCARPNLLLPGELILVTFLRHLPPIHFIADRTATQYDRLLAYSCRPSVRRSVCK